MRILAVRHGDAGDAQVFVHSGQPDHLRPLTARGRRRMWVAARGLLREVPRIDLLATSPYTRAVETAEVLSNVYGELAAREIPELESGAALASILAWLRAHAAYDCIALVGHAPDLVELVTCLTCGPGSAPVVKIKKGGACLLSIDAALTPGAGEIRWLLDNGQLVRLGS
ncbi:MAG: histidine phosphatase family protein [Gammaproteobacteria bacterium]|nr:histidine phosphatase family protein [Gammaproteobacteria bacterium]